MGAFQGVLCPNCGHAIKTHHNPVPTVDVIIELEGGIVLILRKNPPPGWALPGGFVDYGETVEAAAYREAKEETNLELTGLKMFSVYSDPARDPRQHTITTVFVAQGHGRMKGGDDASSARVFDCGHLPELAFDHAKIIMDYHAWKGGHDRGLAFKK
ncbi:MAG: NUDIX hydrolase [Desulfomonilia bacterium]|jgi:ADP-ribose pyrophosphatase YjhB (NUDIX family)